MVCVWLGTVWVERGEGEWMRELGLGYTNPVGTGGVLYMFWLRWGVGRGLGAVE